MPCNYRCSLSVAYKLAVFNVRGRHGSACPAVQKCKKRQHCVIIVKILHENHIATAKILRYLQKIITVIV